MMQSHLTSNHSSTSQESTSFESKPNKLSFTTAIPEHIENPDLECWYPSTYCPPSRLSAHSHRSTSSIHQSSISNRHQQPRVITEQILRESICGDTGEKIDLETVGRMSLAFRSIGHIDNLEGFHNLTWLNLSNNFIERIANLDSLINLKWLDLSFNSIEMIEGLENLVQLTDLSLYSNQLKRLQGLDNLSKLCIISLGKNDICRPEEIFHLQRLPSLKCACLRGNPISFSDTYVTTVVAILKDLIYLDYEMIDDDARNLANDTGIPDDLIEYLEIENARKADLHQVQKRQEKKQLYDSLSLGPLSTFADLIFDLTSLGTDGQALSNVTQFVELKNTFFVDFAKVENDFISLVRENVNQISKEFASLNEYIEVKDNDLINETKGVFKALWRQHKKLSQQKNGDEGIESDTLPNFRSEVENLRADLVSKEIDFNDELHRSLDEIEGRHDSLFQSKLEALTKFAQLVEELQCIFTTKLNTSLVEDDTQSLFASDEILQRTNDPQSSKSAIKDSLIATASALSTLQLRLIETTYEDVGTSLVESKKEKNVSVRSSLVERNRHRMRELIVGFGELLDIKLT